MLLTTNNWSRPTEESSIKGRRSSNYGASFGQSFAVANTFSSHQDVAFGVGGVAHVAFANGAGVYYVFSSKTPYTTWSAPVKLSGNAAEFYDNPSLTVSACGGNATVLHVVWAEYPPNSAGEKYNIYYARKLARTGYAWSPGLRVSDAAMLEGFFGIAANADSALAVWGGVQASRIAPGVICP